MAVTLRSIRRGNEPMSLRDGDSLSWYARKAARAAKALPGVEAPPERVAVLRSLLEQLRDAGIKGDFESMTLYTRRLPPGCRSCLSGKGSNLFVTGLCTRDCFFCFNQKPRRVELYTNGDLADAAPLRRLRDGGIDAIRLDLAARDYDLEPVRRSMPI